MKIRTNIYRREYRSGASVFMVRWRDLETGMWRAIKGGRTKDEAIIVETRVREALLAGKNPAPKQDEAERPLRVDEVIDRFYESSRFLSGTERWQHDVRTKLDKVVKPELGAMLFKNLSREAVMSFYVRLKSGRNLTNRTIRHYHLVMCILGDFYAEVVPGGGNPIRKIQDFTKRYRLEAPSRDINFLTPGEIEKILEELKKSPSPLIYPLVKFLAHSGLRRSEALNLKWTDIDYGHGLIHVRKSKSGKSRSIPVRRALLNAKECRTASASWL